MFPSNETLNIDSDIEIGNALIISLYAFIIFCGKNRHPLVCWQPKWSEVAFVTADLVEAWIYQGTEIGLTAIGLGSICGTSWYNSRLVGEGGLRYMYRCFLFVEVFPSMRRHLGFWKKKKKSLNEIMYVKMLGALGNYMLTTLMLFKDKLWLATHFLFEEVA